MIIKIKPTWQISENQVTPEELWNRRKFLTKSANLAATVAAAGMLAPLKSLAQTPKTNPNFTWKDKDRALTPEELILSYNNFYEFSLEKDEVKKKVESWKLDKNAWRVQISGAVEEKKTYSVEELIKLAGGVEERVYRFRCVEAWSMVVPWMGFPLKALIEKLKPKTQAKFVVFKTFADSKIGPNIANLVHYPWPYTEGLRLDEAMHPLAFIATGIYGKDLAKQNGAPLRLVVPWKYGFKSIKSITQIEFSNTQPRTLWNDLASAEYGFYANVNPEVPHPRWSQATERILSKKLFPERIKTQKFNGYELEVASLYKDMDLKKFY